MTAALMPSGRPVEDMDLAAAVSLARQTLVADDTLRALQSLRQLLELMDASVARAHGPLLFDRGLVADALRYPGKHRTDVVLAQAALVHGTVGQDTPMQNAYLVDRRRPAIHTDDGA